MDLTWKQTAKVTGLSILLGFGGGVLATALTSDYLADYARALGELPSPQRLSEERPRSSPQTYAEAAGNVVESVLPGVAQLYSPGSYAEAFASGAVLTSDGWIVTVVEYRTASAGDIVVVGGKTHVITDVVVDKGTNVNFVKVDASNLPVFAFGNGFDLRPGDQLFVPPSSGSLFVETVVESSWASGALSSDVPERRIVLDNPLLGEFLGAPVVNVRGELVGLIDGGSAGLTTVLPTDGVLSVFNAILRDGKIVRPALGVVATDLGRNLGLDETTTHGLDRGALLLGAGSVRKGSVAAAAGLVPGDVILSVDGVSVDARRSLDELVVTHAPGDVITLRVTDGETEREVSVVLGVL